MTKTLNIILLSVVCFLVSACGSSSESGNPSAPLPSNTAPIASSGNFSLAEDSSLNQQLSASDADNDSLTYQLASSVTNGNLSLSSDGSFSYTPHANFNGQDSFAFNVTDGSTDSNTATVTLIVDPVQDAPIANNASFDTVNSQVSGQLVATDADGETLRFILVTNVSQGSLTLASDGSFNYQAPAGLAGNDQFSFQVNDGIEDSNIAQVTINIAQLSALDQQVFDLIDQHGLTGDPTSHRNLPSINDSMAQLGKRLFFTKSLGGDQDTACVSCHHPALGGDDDIIFPIGVAANNPELIGVGRTNGGLPLVPRNSPTIFNSGLWDSGLFWDSRIESLGKEADQNGGASGIRTPDTNLGISDPAAGNSLAAAQARFPVTDTNEMKGSSFESGSNNQNIRDHLAARIGNYGIGAGELTENQWLAAFQDAFGSQVVNADDITFDKIAHAIGEYERSMIFINNPWKHYIDGNINALTDQQKQGAILFLTPAAQGGGGCINCHSGDKFSDELHHTVAFPQFGPGKGDGNNDDFGRERETADNNDRYRFRTPSLLNIEVTAPYGHAGTYQTLSQVLQHYNNPQGTVTNFFDNSDWCNTAQFNGAANCQNLYPDSRQNSQLALRKLGNERTNNTSLFPVTNLNNNQRLQIEAFLRSLTDPCVLDRNCLSPWIPQESESLDNNQIHAIDQNGNQL